MKNFIAEKKWKTTKKANNAFFVEEKKNQNLVNLILYVYSNKNLLNTKHKTKTVRFICSETTQI